MATHNSGNEDNKNTNNASIGSKASKGLLIFIIIALLVALGATIFFVFLQGEKIEKKDTELMSTYVRLDSITDELQGKINEIERLGGDISELTKAREELEAEKENLLKNKDYSDKQMKDLKNRLEGYRELLVMKDSEIQQLKEINQQLVTENVDLKTEKNQLTETLKEVEKNTEKLSEKVKVASRLEAENLTVYAVASGGKEREGEFRSRQIDQLKVEFNIAKNDVAPIEGKQILIRITDENGNVIFDVAKGSGTFMLDGQETFYTAKQEILFDNSEQKLTFVYNKGSEYERGTYRMEVFTDGYSMGSTTFRVK